MNDNFVIEDHDVCFEVAKLAKEIGYFNGSSKYFAEYHDSYNYDDDPNHPESYKKDDIWKYKNSWNVNFRVDFSNENYTIYEIPTQSVLVDWLEIKHRIVVEVGFRTHSQTYYFRLCGSFHKGKEGELYSEVFSKYDSRQKATEKALYEALKIIQNRNND